jgi:hypothetical protein
VHPDLLKERVCWFFLFEGIFKRNVNAHIHETINYHKYIVMFYPVLGEPPAKYNEIISQG